MTSAVLSMPEGAEFLSVPERMTKAEYDRRLAEIQAELVESCKAEDIRHNAVLSHQRAEFREKVRALHAEFGA